MKRFLPIVLTEYQWHMSEIVSAAATSFRAARTRQELLDAQTDLTIAVGRLVHFTALAAGMMP